MPLHFLNKYIPALEESTITQQQSELIKDITKDTLPTSNYYQGVYVSREVLKSYLLLVSQKYGLDYQKLYHVIECESNFNIDTYSKGHISYGVAQFTQATFKENCIGDYANPLNQISCMGWLWSKGEENRWDCYKILGY